MRRHEMLIQFLQSNGLQLAVYLFGLLLLGLNTYVALKLVPIENRFVRLEAQVNALENEVMDVNSSNVKYIPELISAQQELKDISAQHNRIESDVQQVNLKVDRILLLIAGQK